MNFNKLVLASISFVTGMLMLVFPLQAKVEGDKIILGSAISLTGKYATNGSVSYTHLTLPTMFEV